MYLGVSVCIVPCADRRMLHCIGAKTHEAREAKETRSGIRPPDSEQRRVSAPESAWARCRAVPVFPDSVWEGVPAVEFRSYRKGSFPQVKIPGCYRSDSAPCVR